MDEKTLYDLAEKVQLNQQDEATAVKGYTEQGEIIQAIREKHPDMSDTCDRWEEINDELISDELNHQQKLIQLYSEITGIMPASD